MDPFWLLVLLLGGTGSAISAYLPSHESGTQKANICAKLRSPHDGEDYTDGQPYETCDIENSHCFTFWEEDPNNGTIQIIRQGCWVSSGDSPDCQRDQCISDRLPTRAMNHTKYCCCTGNMCNANFTYIPVNATAMPPVVVEVMYDDFSKVYITLAVFISIAALTTILVFEWMKKKNQGEVVQERLPPPSEYNLNKLKLTDLIGQGRYGSVWKGDIENQQVAIKVFPAHHRNYFLNEYELYQLAGESPALLKCLGGGNRSLSPNGLTDYLLILNLEKECLQEYLKKNVVDLATLSRMSLGIAKGLAHLHSDLGKPAIAHRDLNSRNILVKSDMSCCICDLGLAVVPRKTENHSLTEAGTFRYMAPEVLEGAVNLRDCESALKQIDVYALGLVLWELGSRCTDMQAAEPASYAPPFYKQVGDNPTLEQMQTVVSRRKERPAWPISWKDTPQARLLCDTAEDCWDQDAEARLTSLCVEERLMELPLLKGRSLHIFHPPCSPTALINNNHLHEHSIDASVGTIETLLSPSEENCKNSNQLVVCATPLQAYQGRNPCMERNLRTGSSDSLLIDKSSKHCTSSSDSQSLIASDFLNFQLNQRAMPISYVQNAVHSVAVNVPNVPTKYTNRNPEKSKFKWPEGLKKIFHKGVVRKERQVKLVPSKVMNGHNHNGCTTYLLDETRKEPRPSTLPLLSAKSSNSNTTNKSGISQLLGRKNSLSRQRSLEQFSEAFSSTSDLTRLKDPSQRVKTPGDVPPSVRRTRGKAAKDSARFSLYDDRMMAQWGSAPDLEPAVVPPKAPQLQDLQLDRDSVSSF